MTELEIAARRDALRAEELSGQEHTCYISFAKDVFLGGCYVTAYGPITAIEKAHALGINPGGEAMVFLEEDSIPYHKMNRLLSREELGEDFVRLGDLEEGA